MEQEEKKDFLAYVLGILGNIAAWIIGVFFILGGLIDLSDKSILSGFILILGGALLLPIVRRELNNKFKTNIKLRYFNIAALFLIILGITISAKSKDNNGGVVDKSQSTQVQGIKAQENNNANTAKDTKTVASDIPVRDNRIPEDVFKPYDKENYPKLIKKYKKRLDDVQKYRVKAAEMVLASGKCDKIFMSELSDESTLKNLKFFVDCSSGKQDRRIYLTESEIVKNAPVVAQDEKGLDETEATMMCKKEIEAKSAEYPKVTTHEIAGTAVHKYPQSGRVEVHMDFEITNFYGVEIPYVGHCFFDEDGNGKIKIQRRSGAS